MSVRVRLFACASLVLAAIVGGCGSSTSDDTSAAAEATREFAADNGDVTIPVDPERVVATGYAVPALIEADASLVGISTWERGLAMMSADDRRTYDELDKVAGETAASTDYEAIAALEPDLIVIGVPAPVLEDVDMDYLESIAPVVAIGPTVPDAWRELTQRQADAAGRLDAFETAEAEYEQKAGELAEKYATVLDGMRFGHVGEYGDVAAGTFQREFEGSWGTNIAQDVGVSYYGEVEEKGEGSRSVSEYPSLEDLPESFAEADAITYSVQPDGTPGPSVQSVLDSGLWANLPAVEAGRAFPIRYTEAATYQSALLTLDSIDEALAPLLDR